MASDDPEIRITIGEGAAAREVACRRPTRAELDLPRLALLVGQVARNQDRIRALEAGPADGAAEKIADALAHGEDGCRSIQRRLLAAMSKIAPEADREAVKAWLSDERDGAWAVNCFALHNALSSALAPPSLPGK